MSSKSLRSHGRAGRGFLTVVTYVKLHVTVRCARRCVCSLRRNHVLHDKTALSSRTVVLSCLASMCASIFFFGNVVDAKSAAHSGPRATDHSSSGALHTFESFREIVSVFVYSFLSLTCTVHVLLFAHLSLLEDVDVT